MARIKGKAKEFVEARTKRKLDYSGVKNFIANSSRTTSVYVGCDSRRFRRKNSIFYADYGTAIVVHKDSCHGCRVFGEIQRHQDYGVMNVRLLKEAELAAKAYLKIEDALDGRHAEIHLDVNSDRKAASNGVLKQCWGLVKGMTGISPEVKPDALASSFAAHTLVHGGF